MFTGHQSRAVPCTPILILQDIRQRFMDAPPVRKARALCDRRANERMSKVQRSKVKVGDAGISGGLSGVEIERCPGDRPSGLQDLADVLLVAERGDQQHKASGIGQIGHARSERALKALRQRQSAGHRRLVVEVAGNGWEFEEGERVTGGLAKHAVACGEWKARRCCV
jgi:hypothetical protein